MDQEAPKTPLKESPEAKIIEKTHGFSMIFTIRSQSAAVAPEGLWRAPMEPQDGPTWPQDGPRWPQDGPKTAKDGPKMAPRRPKMDPRRSKMDPRRLLERKDG